MILVSIFLLSNPGSKPQFVDKSRQKNVTSLEGHGKLIIYTILFPFFFYSSNFINEIFFVGELYTSGCNLLLA